MLPVTIDLDLYRAPVLRLCSQGYFGFHDGNVDQAEIQLRRFLPLCPARFHHRRQFLPHGCAHRLPSGGFPGDRLSRFGPRLAFLLCPPSLLCRANSGSRCRAHMAPFPAAGWFSLSALGWTASPWCLGTGSQERCNCIFDTANFLSKLCHYACNVHAYPFFFGFVYYP